MPSFFTEDSTYKKQARLLAGGWTLLIFILCFIPGNELPQINVPLIDKWAHIILFAVFSFLWLGSAPTRNIIYLLVLLLISIFTGWLVEFVQGRYVPGRSQDNMDILADSIGGAAGIILFVAFSYHTRKAA